MQLKIIHDGKYEISNTGRIFSIIGNRKELKQRIRSTKNHYKCVSVYIKKNVYNLYT